MIDAARRVSVFVLSLLAVAILPATSKADTTTLNPVDSGSIYICSVCGDAVYRNYVEVVAGQIVGEVDFSVPSLNGSVQNAEFSVNPYALPLNLPQLEVFGYASTSASISASDLVSPTFLGTWTLPPNLGYGENAFFDVTSFLQTVSTPYVDFILEEATEPGVDGFSSQQYNYGTPPQLTITTPEPSVLLLLVCGMAALLITFRRIAVCAGAFWSSSA